LPGYQHNYLLLAKIPSLARFILITAFLCSLGQAESIAAQIHEEACFKNYDAKIYCLKDEGKLFHVNELSCAIIVCSTTGEYPI